MSRCQALKTCLPLGLNEAIINFSFTYMPSPIPIQSVVPYKRTEHVLHPSGVLLAISLCFSIHTKTISSITSSPSPWATRLCLLNNLSSWMSCFYRNSSSTFLAVVQLETWMWVVGTLVLFKSLSMKLGIALIWVMSLGVKPQDLSSTWSQ